MCGFVGFTSPDSDNKAKIDIRKMMSTIKHRGPDENSIYINSEIALGHFRLSIIDLNGGKQPCYDDNTNYCLVYNGEIYGYKNHAKILKNKGIKLRDNSDTEVLFQSLIYLGIEKTLSMIDGMFAFAFYDGKTKNLWLAKDRMGEKPLYYIHKNNKTFFGSEISSIVSNPNISSHDIDYESLLYYLNLDYTPHNKTIIKSINKVLPGELIKISKHEIVKKQYWEPNFQSKQNLNQKETIENLDNLLKNSVRERLIADVPVGLFLSGGIDSSLVAKYSSTFQPNIKAFTVKLSDETYDESQYGKIVSNSLGIENYIIEADKNLLINTLNEIESKIDEPLGDPSLLPTFIVSKFAKKHVKVVLSGDGADELFNGYLPFKVIKYLNYLKYLPKLSGKSLSDLMEKIPSQDKYMGYHFIIKHISRGIGWAPHQQIFRWMAPLSDKNLKNILNKEYIADEVWKKIIPSSSMKNMELTDQIIKLFSNYYLPNDILTKVDRASMFNSLEVRSPFLSKDLIEFSMKIKNNLKVKNGVTKKILRDLALKNKLPNKIINRKKHGFAIPLSEMIRTNLKEKIEDTILSKNLGISNFFNSNEIEKLLKLHNKGINNTKPIWSIYILFKTYERLAKC
tara:strand:+ start:30869 stop:32740 length:1872 start_codon:yes stop_codon:yes gene_type:complete